MAFAGWPRFAGDTGRLMGIGVALAALVPGAIARPVVGKPQVVAPVLGGGASASAFELTFWQSVAASDDVAQLDAYLAAYPNGAFSQLARLKIAALRQRQAPVAVVTPASPAEPVPDVRVRATGPASAMTVVAAPAGGPEAVAAPPVQNAMTAPEAAPAPVAEPAVSLADQLRLLASGQGAGQSGQVTAIAVTNGLVPTPPVLAPLPEVRLPNQFCSAEARNLFYDSDYKPAMEQADSNNKAAIAHLQALQRLYDERGRSGDIAGQNQLAAASRDYGPVAADAFRTRSSYEAIFNRMMAVPIRPCTAAGA